MRYNAGTVAASDVQAMVNATVSATITSVDAAANKLVIALRDGTSVELKLTGATAITLNSQGNDQKGKGQRGNDQRGNERKGTAAGLKPNALVKVEYNTKTLEALRVTQDTTATVSGTVKSVNTAGNSLIITTTGGRDVPMSINDSTRVIVRGALFGVLGLTAGMKVEAKYDVTTGVATTIATKDRD